MKNIFISGISSGIGKALALEFAQIGVNIYGLSRRPLDYAHNNIHHLQYDITDYDNHALNDFIKGKDFDLCILNAGVLGTIQSVESATITELQKTMDINLWAQKHLIDTLMKEANVSTFIGISSGAAIKGTKGWSGYSLSKAAFKMLIELYADESPYKFISLAPGIVDTNMQEYISTQVDSKIYPNLKRLQEARGTDQMPTPEIFAQKFSKHLSQILETPSGGFIDLRQF